MPLPDPTTIANLALWLDGSTVAAFSDSAGATQATATGRVRRVNQTAPLTGSWLAPSDAQRIFREDAVAFDVPQGNTAIVQPTGIGLPANNATLGFSFTLRDPRGNGSEYVCVGNDGVGRWGIYSANNTFHVFYGGADFDTGISCLMNVPMTGVVRWTGTGIDVLCDVGGVSQSASASATLAARTTAALTIGRNNDSTFGFLDAALVAVVSQLVGYQRAITDAERTTLMAWLLSKRAPVTFTTAAPFILLEGDSIATTGLQFYTFDAWCMKMLPNLWPSSDVRLEDAAVSGSQISDVVARYTTTTLPYLSSGRSKNVVILAIGTNSLADAAKSASAYLADLYALADAIRAAAPAGTKLVGQTILPRTIGAFGTPTTFEADRQTWNTAIRSGYAAHFDALADIATIVGMGAVGNDTNATYYQDGVHPTVAGEVLLEVVYRGAALSVLSGSPAVTGKPLTIERVLDWEADPSIYLFSLKNSA